MSAIAPLAALVAAGLTYPLARALGRRWPVGVPTAVVALGGLLVLVGAARGDLLDQLRGPLGYANATSAACVIAAAAAVLVALRATGPVGAQAARWAAVGFALVPWLIDARAGMVGGVLVLTALSPRVRALSRRRLALASGAAIGSLVAATALAGALTRPLRGTASAEVGTRLTSGRLELWRTALDLWREHPLLGAGRGAYAATSPAHYAHSDFLQLAAEAGALGIAAALGAVAWLLAVAAGDDTPVGALLVLALGLQLAVDYVGRLPAVLVPAAAVLGASTARSRLPLAKAST